MNQRRIWVFFLSVIVFGTNLAFSQNMEIRKDFPIEVIDGYIMPFLEDIPDDILPDYGIKNRDEIRKSTIGRPIAVYTLEQGALSFTDTWRIPLIVDDEYRALFTVFKSCNNEYKIVEFGAVLLAEEFFEFEKEHDFSAMLRVYELRKDFFISSKRAGEYLFYPVPSSKEKGYRMDEIIEMIKREGL